MKPMKPCTIDDPAQLKFPLLGSPKLDGFRMRTDRDGTAMTSNWKPIVNEHVQDVMRILALPYLDGEIIVGKPSGPGVLTRTSSGVTSVDGQPDFKFYVFDTIPVDTCDLGYLGRHGLAKKRIHGYPCLRIVPQKLIRNLEEYHTFNTRQLLDGYEGACYRSVDGVYKYGRATPKEGLLWRYKPFVDSEMRVEGWYEQEENTNEATKDELGRSKRSGHKAGKRDKGVLGGFTGTDIHSGQPVRVGTGYTDEFRRIAWQAGLAFYEGRLLKYKKQLAGEKDKPRHPIFLGWRDANDL